MGFSKIALNWDKIQKTIEEDITERLQNRNEELEAYKNFLIHLIQKE